MDITSVRDLPVTDPAGTMEAALIIFGALTGFIREEVGETLLEILGRGCPFD